MEIFRRLFGRSPAVSTIDKLRDRVSSGGLVSRAKAAIKLGELGDVESVPLLIQGIFDEYLQRMQLADQYQEVINATGGWTPIGGTDEIKKRRSEIESVNLAGACRDAICQIGVTALPEVLKSVNKFKERTAKWHASSRAALAQFLIEMLERLDPAAAVDELSMLRRYA